MARTIVGLLALLLFAACVDDSDEAQAAALSEAPASDTGSGLATNQSVPEPVQEFRAVERTLIESAFEISSAEDRLSFPATLEYDASSVVIVLEITQSLSHAFEAGGPGACGWEFTYADTKSGVWNRFDASEMLIGFGSYVSDRDCGPIPAGDLEVGVRLDAGSAKGNLQVLAMVLEPVG